MSVLLYSAGGVRSFFKRLRGPIQARGSDVLLHFAHEISGATFPKAFLESMESPRALLCSVPISWVNEVSIARVSNGCHLRGCKPQKTQDRIF